ncbi:MAG: PHP domain-containing protein, partial [Eubacteriales bacterium]|nr:PHP domain-containing protein [Eubacteriales bacterium]
MIDVKILEQLNKDGAQNRLDALKSIAKEFIFRTPDKRYVNNHIHSTYSFSPYSPTAVAFAAKEAGLATAGIVDHDSIGGAKEFLMAGEIVGIPTTIGMECRVSMAGTRFEKIRMNNPDQQGISYVTIHGVPHGKIDALQGYFSPLREKRNLRNRQIISNINRLLSKQGVSIDFDREVLSLSMHHDGGTVTERHLMFALAKKIIFEFGRGSGVRKFLGNYH